MSFPTSSSVFDGIRASSAKGGLSETQLVKIAAYIDRSAIFTRRIRDFEQSGGQVEYETTEKNYFWVNEGIPTIYVSPQYKNSDETDENGNSIAPDIDQLTKVLAHELSHYETYFKNGFNPNNALDADGAGAAGTRDEARAYGLEYLVESEINRSMPRVDWMEEGQADAVKKGIAELAGASTDEARRLDAATRGLLDWAANWTGPTITAGGYFQFYKNAWLEIQEPPGGPVKVADVAIRCDASGAISAIDYTDKVAGRKTVVLDRATGKFTASASSSGAPSRRGSSGSFRRRPG